MVHNTATTTVNCIPLAHHLQIKDLPSDILFLVFTSLQGQDIARCIRVCRRFADLIHSDLQLQYRIVLAQNGMVDGPSSSTLPTSERLRRLRQYSSNVHNGIFDRGEDPTAYPDRTVKMDHHGRRSRRTAFHDSSSPVFHLQFDRPAGWFLSAFTHGSTQAGIQPRRWLIPLSTPEGSHLSAKWAVDAAQDLLVMARTTSSTSLAGGLQRLVEIQFLSLDSSTSSMTAHPAASRPSIPVRPDRASEAAEAMVVELAISGEYVIWVFSNPQGDSDAVANYSIQVCNWKTGQAISRLDVGQWPVHVIPLDHPYLLVLPKLNPSSHFCIHTFAPSALSNHICTLQLPEPTHPILAHYICTGRRPPPSEGCFHADPEHWIITLTFHYVQPDRQRFASHLLIPCATLAAQIRAAEARQRDGLGDDVASESLSVPWKDWGPCGCLRLPRCGTPFRGGVRLVPFGSRMPFVAPASTIRVHSSVYVFDLNPLAARHARQLLCSPGRSRCDGSKSETTATAGAIVEDVEATLPGVVDPECSAIPYVVYRFDLPDELRMRAVVMSMSGFMVLSDDPESEKALQIWTA